MSNIVRTWVATRLAYCDHRCYLTCQWRSESSKRRKNETFPPMPKQRQQRPPKRASTSEDDFLGWLESSRLDRIADYVQRGRGNAGLPNDVLFEAWKQTMRSIAKDPPDSQLIAREQDLVSEIEARGLVAPYSEVKDAIEALISRADECVNEEIERDVAEFREKRDRSRN